MAVSGIGNKVELALTGILLHDGKVVKHDDAVTVADLNRFEIQLVSRFIQKRTDDVRAS